MKTNYFKTGCLFLVVVAAFCCGCGKNGAITADAKGTYVYDLVGDTAASVGLETGKTARAFYPLLYNFSTKESHLLKTAEDSAKYLQRDWDIAFTEQYNSTVVPNNGFLITETNAAFDAVTAAPSDAAMAAGAIQNIGWDQGDGQGWYYYSMTNHISVAIPNRTFIFKTGAGLYGKVVFISIYKGHPDVVTDLYWPTPYLTFRYFLQTDGSKNLTTK